MAARSRERLSIGASLASLRYSILPHAVDTKKSDDKRSHAKDIEYRAPSMLRGNSSASSQYLSRTRSNAGAKSKRSSDLLRGIGLILARPYYILRRRGPFLPVGVFFLIILVYLSVSPDVQSPQQTPSFNASAEGEPLARKHPSMQRKPRNRMERLVGKMPGADWAALRWSHKIVDAKVSLPEDDMDESQVGSEDALWTLSRRKNDGLPELNDLLAPHHRPPRLKDASRKANALPQKSRSDGRLLLIEGEQHPIPMLMHRAKRRWRNLQAKQSKTFKQAVAEYKRRYGRQPPKGFDRWYAFARANNVRLIDEFDLIERDLHAFRAFSPASFRARVERLKDTATFDWTWGFNISSGRSERVGQLAHHQRARDVESLCKRFVHELPDMTLWYNGHDIARIMVPWEEVDRLNGLVQSGLHDEDDTIDHFNRANGPEPGWGLPQICSPDSAVRQKDFVYGEASRAMTGMEMPDLPLDDKNRKVTGTLIDSFKKYMDVCESPQYRHFHSSTSFVYPHWPTGLLPLLTPGVQSNFNDIHALIVEQFDMADSTDPAWEDRPFDKVIWRGQTSGPQWDAYSAWITSHRSRLHLLSHATDGVREVTMAVNESPSSDGKTRSDTVQRQSMAVKDANAAFLDTGMVGPAVQCIAETCDEMNKVYNGFDARVSSETSNLYKYALDVDGNSWSGRFRRLMLSNAAVLKATVYTEFWTDWAIPWLHFIPVQVDYSDLWDIMAFFRGGLAGENAHDELAKEIALAGRDWASKHFRWADLEAYQFRLMLEYGRLWAEDRSAMDLIESEEDTEEPVWEEKTFQRQRRKRKTVEDDDQNEQSDVMLDVNAGIET